MLAILHYQNKMGVDGMIDTWETDLSFMRPLGRKR